MKRVAHVITGLGVGGAETFLLRAIPEFDKRHYQSIVVYLTGGGEYVDAYKEQGITVIPLGIRSTLGTLTGFVRLVRILKDYSPDIIQGWMYHANLLAGLAGKLLGLPVIWGIQQSNLGVSVNKASTRRVIWMGSILSKSLPKEIVYDSEAARAVHERRGFDQYRGRVFPNGVNEQAFVPRAESGQKIRQELAIPSGSIVVGHIARYDVQKDQKTFLQAIKKVRQQVKNLHVIMAGRQIDWSNTALVEDLDHAVDREWIHLLGPRSDVADLYNAMDIFCSSSIGESCPNVVLEAMMMGVPCVATDVGDVRHMLGEEGVVVPSADLFALADALVASVSLSPDRLREIGLGLRTRALNTFTLTRAADRFIGRYDALVRPPAME
jgi:glycosyltransferase involved in cell wall biosynthesis